MITHLAGFLGRLCLAALFLYSGIMKLYNPAPAEGMLAGVGMPAGLAVPAGIFEIVAAAALILGFMTRLFAILLAGYVLLTIVLFHNDFTTFQGMIAALSHLALVGGLLCLLAISQMRWSYDAMRLRRQGELATRDAEARLHDAELRAARAEGRAELAGSRAVVTDLDRDGVPEVRRKRRWFG